MTNVGANEIKTGSAGPGSLVAQRTSRWTVGVKIATGYALAILALLVVAGLTNQTMNQLAASIFRVDASNELIKATETLRDTLVNAETGQRGYVLTGDERYLEPYHAALGRLDEEIKTLKGMIQEGKQHHETNVTFAVNSIRLELDELKDGIVLRKEKGFDAAVALILTHRGRTFMDDIRASLGAVSDAESANLEKYYSDQTAKTKKVQSVVLVGIFLSLVCVSIAGLLITRNITRPLAELSAAAERIAIGDLSVDLSAINRGDEVGILSDAFKRMTASLEVLAHKAEEIAEGNLDVRIDPNSDKDRMGTAFAQMIENIRTNFEAEKKSRTEIEMVLDTVVETANQLAASSEELVATASQLATGMAEHSATTSEVASTVAEVVQSADQVSERAATTAQRTEANSKIGTDGKKAVEGAISSMREVKEHSESVAQGIIALAEQAQTIGEIVATVNEIADKTNLLALNAAIEASRAGEHGKGFSVVASEVKQLADQSKKSTVQVREILGEIQKATNTAVMTTEEASKSVIRTTKITEETGVTVTELARVIEESVKAASQTKLAAEQQAIGMVQIHEAITSMATVTTDSAAATKQVEQAAQDLNALSGKLREVLTSAGR